MKNVKKNSGNRKNIAKLGICLFVFAALMAIFTFADLPLSQKLYAAENTGAHLFGFIFAATGQIPGMLIGAFCAAALFALMRPRKKTLNTGLAEKKSLSQIFFFCVWLGLGVAALLLPAVALKTADECFDVPLYALCIASAVLAPLFYFLALKAEKTMTETQKKAFLHAALTGFILVAASSLIIHAVKIPWGRARMRILDDSFSQFTYWFLPQGRAANDDFKSFPSGHSGAGALVIWFTLLPSFLPRLNTKPVRILLTVLVWAWILCVMVSRIVAGAHFATDTIAALAITLLCFSVSKKIATRILSMKNVSSFV